MSANRQITRYNNFIRDFTIVDYNLNTFIAEFETKGFLINPNDFLLKSYMIFFLRFTLNLKKMCCRRHFLTHVDIE